MNKCLESKWLQLTDSMIKTRNTHLFRTETLRDFSELYLERKGDNQYMDLAGVTGESLAKVGNSVDLLKLLLIYEVQPFSFLVILENGK